MLVIEYPTRKAEVAKEILMNPDYTDRVILDLSSFYNEDRARFNLAVEMLGTLKILSIINEFMQVRGCKQIVKTEILQTAIPCVIDKRTFDEDSLEEWFLFIQEFDSVAEDVIKLHDMDAYYTNTDVDLLLLGV
jgi:hypothetical protein